MRKLSSLSAIPFALAVGAGALAAQAPTDSHSLFVIAGGNWTSLGGINSALRSQQYSEIDKSAFAIGAGTYFTHQRVLIGAEGGLALRGDKSAQSGTIATDFHSGFAMVDLGYVWKSDGATTIYPVIGAGAGQARLGVTWSGGTGVGPSTPNPTFDDVLFNPGSHSTLDRNVALFSVGLAAERYLVSTPNGDGARGIVGGVRAGYRFAPALSDWKLYGRTVQGGPDAGLSGAFLVFTLGPGARGPVK